MAYSVLDKTGLESGVSFDNFCGQARITRMYSDNAPEFISLAKKRGIPMDNSLPGKPVTNSKIERANRTLVETTRALLAQAGLPVPYWDYAAQYECMIHNLSAPNKELSPWQKRFGNECQANVVPFGALVMCNPPKTSHEGKIKTKFGPSAMACVFLGHEVGYGCRWKTVSYTHLTLPTN